MNETIKFFMIVVIVVIILLIIANIELKIVENKAVYSTPLTKTYLILTPSKTGLNDPVYVYNSKNIKSKDVPKLNGYNVNYYNKTSVDKHLATKLNDKITELFSNVGRVPKSSMPINALYNVVSKGEEIATTLDPMTSDKSTYKALHSTRDNVEFFINNDKLYVMNIK